MQELENKSYAYQKFKELREKANLKLDKLSLIAKFFGISVSDFIEDDETCKKESS